MAASDQPGAVGFVDSRDAGGEEGRKRRPPARRFAKHGDANNAIVASDPDAAAGEMELHLQELIDHPLLVLTGAGTGYVARELTPEALASSS